jgi:oligoribonuclease NrnB/cAMP/cGMP phosphodiesterase (DHH superfamily)
MDSLIPYGEVKHIVMFHDNCTDGFGAAWLWRKYGQTLSPDISKDEDTAYIPVNYNHWLGFQVLEMLKPGVSVAILDFSFTKAQIRDICERVFPGQVVLLDHHKTAQEELSWSSADRPRNYLQTLDMNFSGIGVVNKWYFANRGLPVLAQYIQDRDLWKFSLSDSKALSEVIRLIPKTFQAYDNLARRFEDPLERTSMAKTGYALLQQQAEHLDQLEKLARPCVITVGEESFRGLAVNGPEFYASELGHRLASKSGTFGMIYGHKADGSAKVNLRSVGDFDVSIIAKAFGGGGHKNAAGFIMTDNLTTDTVTFFTGKEDN